MYLLSDDFLSIVSFCIPGQMVVGGNRLYQTVYRKGEKIHMTNPHNRHLCLIPGWDEEFKHPETYVNEVERHRVYEVDILFLLSHDWILLFYKNLFITER